MVLASERGGRSMIDDSTHWYKGMQPTVRLALAGSSDPVLKKAAAELSPKAQQEAHREIEVSLLLTQAERDRAMGVLEKQEAKRVLEGEYHQVWYDASHLCQRLTSSTQLAARATCNNMEIRVRSLTTAKGIEYHWALKVKGSNGSVERIEHENKTDSWEAALVQLNAKIAEVLFADDLPQITKNSKPTMSLKKTRISYRYDERADGKQYACSGSQVDFDVWYEVNGKNGGTDKDGNPIPLFITVDVEGHTLNGDATGLTPEEARQVPSVENCVWCLSLPEKSTYNLFQYVESRGWGMK